MRPFYTSLPDVDTEILLMSDDESLFNVYRVNLYNKKLCENHPILRQRFMNQLNILINHFLISKPYPIIKPGNVNLYQLIPNLSSVYNYIYPTYSLMIKEESTEYEIKLYPIGKNHLNVSIMLIQHDIITLLSNLYLIKVEMMHNLMQTTIDIYDTRCERERKLIKLHKRGNKKSSTISPPRKYKKLKLY